MSETSLVRAARKRKRVDPEEVVRAARLILFLACPGCCRDLFPLDSGETEPHHGGYKEFMHRDARAFVESARRAIGKDTL